MTVYRRKPTQPLKWLVALIVFGLAMGITFSDVYGNSGDNAGTGDTDEFDGRDLNGPTGGSEDAISGEESLTAIPEPSTLLLLAGGLSALYVARRRKNRTK